ncbi:MAG: hypothetical protein M5U14_17040 [Acidimicrobiia bacterium]|nr:hypothetical protein [Acidimicrobiia bacterium]
MRRTARPLAVVAAVAALVLAACGSDDGSDAAPAGTGSPEATTAPPSGDAAGSTSAPPSGDAAGSTDAPTVRTASSDLGEILVDGDGRTLYVFLNDTGGTSTCSGTCADAWPPVTVDGDVAVGPGLDAAGFGTITRDDGSRQVTIGEAPLYLYAGDAAAGDVNGQGLNELWYVVGTDGAPIGAPPAAAGAYG